MCFLCFFFFPLSGPYQSWPVTHTPWWQFHCMIHSAQRPSATLSTKVHKQAPSNTHHTPPAVLLQRSRSKRLIPTQAKWVIWCHLFFSCHLDGDLRRAREGSDDPGLRQQQRANGEDDCAHRGVRQRPGDPWTRVWHRGSEFQGV